MQQLTLVDHIGNSAEVKTLETTQVINFSLAATFQCNRFARSWNRYKNNSKTPWPRQ